MFSKGAQWLSGRGLDSRPKGRGFEPHRRHCIVSLSKNINPSLVQVQPRKTRPFITERLLMGRKESNQTNKQTKCFQRVFNFRGTRWNIDKCVTVAYWSILVKVYPETSFKSLSKAIYVLHYSLRQYNQYTVIGRTALVTSQIQGK